ncbi:MAG: formate dehydrogenase subunit alpha [Candidatus Omnitrophica bacterium]|nr:formate dehydrogenase subunit alpha [Candidatus Omnitrophota bacterium]MBU1366584.1 formate dehydrogenase subunit alpha [Candidatus Omnitrophota bacterium]MBU1523153.1 formate dehydrogenase subunit alpha [Candidatus Omnitrophota bacterium]MBU1810595.1 formate dehydrogenase subunit alpha [Candidatus Omnitrophota bacterium]MBU2436267.1 formate dehydrogenase subunit alpha [Candidatus Omnitrophota bacterium]
MQKILTTCIYCGCGCGLYLTEDKGIITGAYPSIKHPVSKGALCVKGWNSYEFVNSLDRLTHPLIKENGKFRKATWDEAIKLIAEKFKAFSAESGADSLAFLSSAKTTNEENYLMMKLARAVFKTNNVDHCARLCHASTVAGLAATFGSGAMTNSINEFQEADCYLITGSDTTSQHPLIGSRIINSVLNRGAKLIIVDPRKIELSKYAAVNLQQKNGTDVAWVNGMMHVIIKEGLQDEAYIQARTEGFAELKELVGEYTPEYVEKITTIPKEKLIEAARLYAVTKKAMIVYSMGITQHTTGVDNVKSLANLAMLTGHVGFPSTGVNPLRGQNNVQGACDLGALANVFSGYQKVTDAAAREKFEKAWGVSGLPANIGLTVTEIITAAGGGKVKGLYIMGENPMISDPDQNHVRKCLEKTEFLVVQDIFLTDTAQYADVILPGASYAEKDGTFTNTERRCERVRKAIEPLGEAKADWRILCDVAVACGYNGMNFSHPSEVMEEIRSVTPIYGGMRYDRLEPHGLQWPCPTLDHPGTPYLHKDKFSKGKGTFMPRPFIEPRENTDEEFNFILSTGRIYWHWHTRTLTGRTSTLEREAPVPYVEIHSEDAAEMGIKNKEKVRVTSRRGQIELQALITDRVVRKSCFIPFHYREAAANVLTINAIDPIAKIPEYKVCAVKVEKL